MFSNIFDGHKEIDRLAVQNRLLKEYELPVYQRLMEGRKGLRVLDVGCNNGSKTADRFAHPSVEKIIGLEYNQDLVEEAQATYGDRWFSFYQCDVEQPDFAPKLRGWMEENQIAAFDLIHISLVLLHLERPGLLLGILRGFLAPGGKLMIIEANDSVSGLSNDPKGMFANFMDILVHDPFSGARNFGSEVPLLLKEQGYCQIVLENEVMYAKGPEQSKKEQFFDVFFSYLPEDILLLREQEPDNQQYVQWEEWMRRNYESLHQLVLNEHSDFSVGLSIYTCTREEDGPFSVHPLTEEYLDEVTELSNQCMGKNMYPRDFIASIMDQPKHYFKLLLTPEGVLAGYFYFFLTDLETVSAAAKLPVETMSAISSAKDPVVARFQSLGIVPAFRNHGLARRLLLLALEEVQKAGADSAVAIAWKMNGFVPIADNLLGCGFQYLTDSHMVWYDMEDMVCPYCKGRCKCDSAIYYKNLKGRD